MPTYSSLEQLNQIIQTQNPFENHFIVKTHHIWDEDFPDVPILNSHASGAILDAVEKINSAQIKSKTAGFALLAPKGTGKTHLLSRIREQLKKKGSGFFIYICEYGDLNQIKAQFLQNLASSLKKPGAHGVMQWQELAAALISRAMGKSYVAQALIDQFPAVLVRRPQFVNQLTIKVHQNCPDIDNPYIIKAILWTLSQAHAPFAINWLSGRELSDAQARMMDLSNPSRDDKGIEAFNAARQILELISYYTTPVICFDQLDGTEIADEEDVICGGFTRAQVVGSLAMDIYNNLRRGVVIAAMYTKTWKDEFSVVRATEAVTDRINTELELKPLKPDDVVLLVSYWLETFYNESNLAPPHPLYPFDENQLREVGKNNPTVREVLQWCAKNFSSVEVNVIERLERVYQRIEVGLDDFSDDNERIANALVFALQILKGSTIKGVTVLDIDREVKPKSKHRGWINFRILGTENEQEVKIGVCVFQNPKGQSVGAAIKYLTWYRDFNFTRGCLVRSKSISKNWQVANASLKQLLEEQGGEWVSFKDEEIKPLLAINQMYKELDREVFTDEDFYRFIEAKYPISENALVLEILSDPSGQSPQELVDEDQELERLLSQEIAQTDQQSDEMDLLEASVA